MSTHNLKSALILSVASLGLFTFSGATAMAATASAPAVTASQAESLRQGASGPAVSRLQEQLRMLGHYSYPSITGYFGPVTASATRSFQDAYGLPVTGVADGSTQKSLDRAVTMLQLAEETASYTGIPYRWGGSSPSTGFDCSGFVYYMYQSHGIPLQRLTSQRYFTMGIPVDRNHLQPGDLVFFNTAGVASHMGIYLGGGQWVSATSSRGIKANAMDNLYWGPRYDGARRL